MTQPQPKYIKTNANDRVSPELETQLDESSNRLVPVLSSYGGLTKREYFAAMALSGMLAGATTKIDAADYKRIPDNCVYLAEALVEALNREAK